MNDGFGFKPGDNVRVPFLALLSQDEPPSPDQAKKVFEALRAIVGDRTLDRFGWAYTALGGAFSFVPWSDGEGPGGNPLLFVDESRDETAHTTLYAGLVMAPAAAFILAGWYLGNLVTLRRQIPAVWPADAPPPRLHFRELFSSHARQKTTWSKVPERGICDLISNVADALGENEHVHPFVVTIPDAEVDKGLASAFPGGVDLNAVDGMVSLIVGNALRTAIVDNTRRGMEIELVIDFDATRISLGKIREADNALDAGRQKQATLHFMETLASTITDPRVLVDTTNRHTSSFPTDFTWSRFETDGYPFAPVVNAIGLQFADLYVNVWRHLEHGAYQRLKVSRRILTRARRTDFFWAPPEDGDMTP
jgi:hypothetical protein